jgi:hypothetical protein
MKSIDHLPDSEKQHFIQCSLCDEYYDMRDLNQVREHEHAGLEKANWDTSRKIIEPTERPNPDTPIR